MIVTEGPTYIRRCPQCRGLMTVFDYVDDRQTKRQGAQCKGECKKQFNATTLSAITIHRTTATVGGI
jgi:predicted nucleic acid-binding Zn ribbon protein